MHPITKTNFGVHGIAVSYYNTTTSAVASGYVIKQTGTAKYVVSSDAGVHKQVISLAQTSAQVSAIGVGQPTIGTILITPYGVVGAKATGTITIGTLPQANDTIAVGGTTVTFVASGATGNQVNIAGSAILTAAALKTFLSASTDTNISKATYANTAGSNLITVTYKTGGTAGNSFGLVPTSGGRISVSAATLTGGTAAAVEHVRELYDSVAQTVEGHRYAWSKTTSVNESAVIAAYS